MVRFSPGMETWRVVPGVIPGGTWTLSMGCPKVDAIGDRGRGVVMVCRCGVGEIMVVSMGPAPIGTAIANGSSSSIGGGNTCGNGGGARGVMLE